MFSFAAAASLTLAIHPYFIGLSVAVVYNLRYVLSYYEGKFLNLQQKRTTTIISDFIVVVLMNFDIQWSYFLSLSYVSTETSIINFLFLFPTRIVYLERIICSYFFYSYNLKCSFQTIK